jgi:hypothetical protein
MSLHRSALVQSAVYDTIAEAVAQPDGKKAIVLGPPFFKVWGADPQLAQTGTWVHEWRRPRPDFTDDVIYLHDAEGLSAQAIAQFPDRKIFRLSLTPQLGVIPLN